MRGAVLFSLFILESLSGFAQVELWLTSPLESARFELQPGGLTFVSMPGIQPTIEIDENRTFQAMDGFGFCLTGGSARHLSRMDRGARAALLEELFSTKGRGIGSSYLRITIGASDLNERVYSYDDLPAGEIDPGLTKFSLEPDRTDVIPILKQILAINPALTILGSPWSPPPWMKTNHDTVGGSLDPKFYGAYAQYFVKYLEGNEGPRYCHPGDHGTKRATQSGKQPQFAHVGLGTSKVYQTSSRPSLRGRGVVHKNHRLTIITPTDRIIRFQS